MVERGECYRANMYMPYDAPVIRHFTIMLDFFDVLGIEVEAGRALGDSDDAASELVALVNRPLASTHFEQGKPIAVTCNRMVLHEAQIADAALRELGAPLRYLAALLLGMTLLVVLLGVHGAYALQRFRVANQRRELSVRLALGSTPLSLTRHVLGQTARLVRIATVVGMFGALGAARGVQVLIPGAPPFEPGVFTAITVLLVAAALLGALLPAVRVARLDPTAVLD